MYGDWGLGTVIGKKGWERRGGGINKMNLQFYQYWLSFKVNIFKYCCFIWIEFDLEEESDHANWTF